MPTRDTPVIRPRSTTGLGVAAGRQAQRFVASPPLAPDDIHEAFDDVVRVTWGQYLRGQISEALAGEIHDQLIALRRAALRAAR
jgi:hypothetical protein